LDQRLAQQCKRDVRPYPPAFPAQSLTKHDGRKYRLLVEREAMISLAGDLAVWKFRGTPLKKAPTESDLTMVSHAASLVGDTQGGIGAYLDRIAARTRLYLDVYWEGVMAVAAELLDRRSLSCSEVGGLPRRCRSRT
jgi:hypothetical protein